MFDFENPTFLKNLDGLELRLVETMYAALTERRPAKLCEATHGLQTACRNNPALAAPLMEGVAMLDGLSGTPEIEEHFHLKAISAAETALLHGIKGSQAQEAAGSFLLNAQAKTVLLLGHALAARKARLVALHAPGARRGEETPAAVWTTTVQRMKDTPSAMAAEILAAQDAASSHANAPFLKTVREAAVCCAFLFAKDGLSWTGIEIRACATGTKPKVLLALPAGQALTPNS